MFHTLNAPGRRIAQIVLTMCRLLIRMNVGDRIDHVQVVDQDERGDHPAAEEHRDHKDHVEKVPSNKLLLGHRVCGEQRH